MAEPVVVTPQDVQTLNRTAIVRSSAFARFTGTVLVIIGVVGALAWLWVAVRNQQQLSDQTSSGGFGGGGGVDVDLLDRLDVLAPNFFIAVIAAVCAGFGFMLRQMADFMVDRVGGSITGFEPGDTVSDENDDAVAAAPTGDVDLEPLPRPE